MEILIRDLWKLDVKTDYYCICENCPIQELNEFEKIKILDTLVNSHQPIYFRKLIGFWQHHVTTGAHPFSQKKLRIAQHWSEHYEILSRHTPFIVIFPMMWNVWQGALWFGTPQHGQNWTNKL
jgi:hypothetical protein